MEEGKCFQPFIYNSLYALSHHKYVFSWHFRFLIPSSSSLCHWLMYISSSQRQGDGLLFTVTDTTQNLRNLRQIQIDYDTKTTPNLKQYIFLTCLPRLNFISNTSNTPLVICSWYGVVWSVLCSEYCSCGNECRHL